MALHLKKLLWFTTLMVTHPDGLTKQQIDKAWERSGFSNPNQVIDFRDNGEEKSRISLPRTTMYRYIEEVEDTFNLKIVCQKGTNLWIIDKLESKGYSETILQLREVLVLLGAVNEESNLKDFIGDLEPIYGIENMIQTLDAVRDRKIIGLCMSEHPMPNTYIKPYGLKKINRQWCLVGVQVVPDSIIAPVGVYPLDRMYVAEITNKTFEIPDNFNIDEYFSDFVGPIVDFTIPKERILLETDKWAGRHIESQPIHHSQTMLDSTEEHKTFEFLLRPTECFYREILKYGSHIQILEPTSVRKHIRDEAEKLMTQNQ